MKADNVSVDRAATIDAQTTKPIGTRLRSNALLGGAMLFDPNEHFAIVTGNAVKETGVRKEAVMRRICSSDVQQMSCERWKGQPAVIVDDGRVRWKVTFTEKVAHDGRKRVAYVVEGERYAEESRQTRSRFWAST